MYNDGVGLLDMNASRHLSLAPTLCVCVLSYKRLDLLRVTLRSIIRHLEDVETGLPYEIVWVDNGSDNAERQALHSEFPIEKALFMGTNYGMAYGFNSLFFRLCSAPYFLTMEEDWEWLADDQTPQVGHSALHDAIAVLRHDAGVSGVFLRPDTLDQFLPRGSWLFAPRRSRGAASTDAPAPSGQPGGLVEYARYCMDRSASFLWGAYSNGPGVYDRDRLMRLVGRQYGEPLDQFPDVASESNYAYRVGAAGLCSAVMRIWPECDGVAACNAPLIRHIGDERSHGYGKGRRADIRWLVAGSNHSNDADLVTLRSLDVEPTVHWLSLYLSRGEHMTSVAPTDGRIDVLVAARATTLAPVAAMARALLRASHAPGRVALYWLVPAGAGAAGVQPLLAECTAASAAIAAEFRLASADTSWSPLRCVPPPRATASLAERFQALLAASDASLLLLCPRLITAVQPHAAAAVAVDAAGSVAQSAGTSAWDRWARAAFGGDGDVRTFPKDQILLMQAAPLSAGVPAGHALVHRAALDHLDYASPPAGESWLLHALWLQSLFGSVGRHRRIDTVAFEEVDDVDTNAEEGGSLRARFERTAPARSTRTA